MEARPNNSVAPVVSTSVTSSDVTTSIATAAADSPTDSMAAVTASADSSLNMAESAEVLAGGSSFKQASRSNSESGLSNESKSTGQHAKRNRRPPRDEIVLFLCPNGHKLHGLRELAGKVGQCPHCAAKFEIPFPDLGEQWHEDWEDLDDTVTEDPLQEHRDAPIHNLGENDYEPLDEAQFGGSETTSELEGLFEAVRADTGSSVLSRITGRSDKGKQESAIPSPPLPPPLPAPSILDGKKTNASHVLADLVRRLWAEREHGGVIELHLSGGAMLVPEWFDEKLSRDTHGLFAAQAADGTVTMTVVPWDEVTRVVVRGVVGLPDGMFEE
jgi:hypothetical protein